MRKINARQLALIAGGIIILFFGTILLLRSGDKRAPVEFEIQQVATNGSGGAVVTLRMKNTGHGIIDYASTEDATAIVPRCEFIQALGTNEKRWTDPPTRSNRFLSPGEAVICQVSIPSGGPVRIGVLLRHLPYTRWTENSFVRKVRQVWFMIRVKIASRQPYEPCWVPETAIVPTDSTLPGKA